MHWRYKTVDLTLLIISLLPSASGRSANPPGPFFLLYLFAISPPAAPAIRELSYCIVWEVRVLKDSLLVSAIPVV